MAHHAKTIRFFWAEVKRPFLLGCAKTVLLFPVAILVAIVTVRALQCAGWMGDESQRVIACAEVLAPEVLLLRIVAFLPTLLIGTVVGLPFLFLGVLYLEWDKYKKDEAPHLGGYWGWTVPNRPWSRSNFERLVTGQAWTKHPQLKFHASDEESATVSGCWRDEELLHIIKGVSRRYTSLLRKPLNQTADLVEWHFLINGGDELRLKFERSPVEPTHWTLIAGLYEWAGRKQPPRLAQTHVTEFVLERECPR